jgi:hypothetical protein
MRVVGVIFGTVWTLACVNGSEVPKEGSGSERAKPREVADGAPDARDVCALLSADEVAKAFGVAVERVEKKPDGCEWYSNAAQQQQKGVDVIAGTFGKLTKEEPKSAEEGVRRMEEMLKGLTSAVSPGKPLFAVSVQWENADQAEAMVKTVVGVTGGGAAGGRLETIDGLGDRAYVAAAGVLFYVRRGPALLTFGSLGTREQTIALARTLVSRM